MKKCKTCGEGKSFLEFGENKYSKDGLNYDCKSCRASYEAARRESKGIKRKPVPIVSDSHKECLRCRNILDLECFSKSSRGRLGRVSYCKSCQKEYILDRKSANTDGEKLRAREATRKYRENNLERWRGLHRINQFNRKSNIRAVSDGTVTDDFLKGLYALENCYWCRQKIPVENRTAEHITPLNLGGPHSAANLTMACRSCNSSKKNFNDNCENN